jgi:hypothetical protein
VISNVSVRPLSAGHWLLPAVAGWVPLAVAQMVLALIVYSVVQQDIRQSANEPQIELAESAASRLSSDEPVQTVLPARSVDLSGSLAPFVIVYDGAGTVLASSASLQGQTPRLPSGTLGSVTRGLESGSRAPGVRLNGAGRRGAVHLGAGTGRSNRHGARPLRGRKLRLRAGRPLAS